MKSNVLQCIYIGLIIHAFILAGNSRFNTLETDSISSVTIRTHSQSGEILNKQIENVKQIDSIISFLKDMEIQVPEQIEDAYPDDSEEWVFHIQLNGYFDQVYIFQNTVFIGKSAYQIRPQILSTFRQLYSSFE